MYNEIMKTFLHLIVHVQFLFSSYMSLIETLPTYGIHYYEVKVRVECIVVIETS